jgi:hypothetical protein
VVRRLAVVVLLALGACSLFESLPDKSCSKVQDCFQAQGETCDLTTHTCVAGPDAQIVTPAPAPVVTP